MDQPEPFDNATSEDETIGRASRDSDRHRRQRNLVAGCAVVLAVATGIGGYAIGNSNDSVSLRSDTTARAGGGPATASKPSPDLGPRSALDEAASPPMTAQSAIGMSPYGSAKLVISRRTANGIELRAWRMASEPPAENPGNLPPACIGTGMLVIGAMSDSDMAQSTDYLTADTTPVARLTDNSMMPVGSGSLGVLSVHNVDAKRVDVTFPDGSTDSMAPVEGIAVFAPPPGSDAAKVAQSTIVATYADGTSREIKIPTEVAQPDCTPRLPEPGEQPADPAAAKAAIAASMDKLFDQSLPIDDKIAMVDDPTGVEAAYNAVMTGGMAEIAKTARYHLVDLVFTSPTEATVKYDIMTGVNETTASDGSGAAMSGSTFSGRIGTVRLVDGTWKVSRSMICADLLMGGGSCDGQMPPVTAMDGVEPMPVTPAPLPMQVEGSSTGSDGAPTGR